MIIKSRCAQAGAILLTVLVLLSFSPDACAQGGKAEPSRVQFPRGRSSTVLTGKLRSDWQAEYAINARERQKMTLRLNDSPAGSITLKAKDPDGNELPLQADGKQQWMVVLPKTGDYQFWVVRASDKPGTSQYKVTVTIR